MTRTEAGDTLRRKLLYPNLTMLDVSNNNLTSIPPDVNEVSQLTELKLNNNKLKEVSRMGRRVAFQRLFILLIKKESVYVFSFKIPRNCRQASSLLISHFLKDIQKADENCIQRITLEKFILCSCHQRWEC